MLPDKEVKKRSKLNASKDPEKFYATKVLSEEGFKRRQCAKCGTWFWTVNDAQLLCGDASCQGGFSFLEDNPAKNKLYYSLVWQRFSTMFKKEGYEPISRFPVVARWNPTTNFTIASIAAFQPFVISGESKPPAKKLVIPQFCLRFGDVANVGITMSHLTGFVMIGQHQFVDKKDWDQNKAFREIYNWLMDGLGLDKSDITFHEDAWAGGGNFGPCMEFFSRGVELGNQVYMMYEQIADHEKDELNIGFGYKELSLKVLDMGMGMERNAWFSQATPTIYEASFPDVIKILVEKTKVDYDTEFIRSYVPYGAFLNLDEVENIDEAWESVAEKMSVSVELLKKKLRPMTAIYSIAEHARSLLFALSDGALPSNVGGGYNLRVIFRRAQSFIDEFNWKIDLADVCELHVNELKDLFPELKQHLPEVRKILASEKKKYREAKKRNEQFIRNVLKKRIPTTEDLLTYYESHGITPDEFVEIDKELTGEPISQIEVPDNFYSLLAERQEENNHKALQKTATKKKDHLEGIYDDIPGTTILYYGDWQKTIFDAKILQVLEAKDPKYSYVILDKTAFYPTSGGQIHDKGMMNSFKVIDCVKQGKFIVHYVETDSLKEGDLVHCEIDFERRKQLTQHHTATHIINGASREVLGDHIWQAGASKTLTKARLDITHYESLSEKTLQDIEKRANEIVKENIEIKKYLLPRSEAENRFGFRLYQGGAVPGSMIRVVEIPGVDVEACGGTHLNFTSEVEEIKILKSTKVQDGIVRLEFVAGSATKETKSVAKKILSEASNLLSCLPENIPSRAEELFTKWKKAKKKKLPIEDFPLTSKEVFSSSEEEAILSETAKILKTQPEHVVKTLSKFLKQLESFKSELNKVKE